MAFLGPGKGAEIIRVSQDLPGDSKAIILHADQATTWIEGGTRIVLLEGTAIVQHGIVHVRAMRAVAWIHFANTGQKGISDVEVYAEGNVQVERGSSARYGQEALVDLHTRGEIKLRTQTSKVVQAARPDDALFQRASSERTRLMAAQPIARGASPDDFQPVAPPLTAPAPPPLTAPAPTPVTAPAPTPQVAPATPPAQAPAPPPGAVLPAPRTMAPGPAPVAPPRQLQIAPRTSAGFQVDSQLLPNGEEAIFITGGVILTIHDLGNISILDIEADRMVLWTKSGNLQQLFSNMRSPGGETTREAEFYLSGFVELRAQQGKVGRTIRADEMYYDVGRNVAIAHHADLEFKQPGLPDPVHLRADELHQLSPTEFKGFRAEVFSSRLPSDPGLKVYVQEATLDEVHVPKRSIFGVTVTDSQGRPVTERQDLVDARNAFLELENIPIFWTPFLQGDANDPLGPLENVNVGYNRVFGAQIETTWNMYDLLGLNPIPGTRWRLDIDELTRRGPALGTEYEYAGDKLFDIPGRYNGLIKAYGMYDKGTDILGGGRGADDDHPLWRGRFLERHYQEMPDGFTLQTQVAVLSDQNFLEQYFKNEFDRDVNQETFAYLKQQQGNWAWTILGEPYLRPWVTETEWLPKADGYLLGQSLFDIFTYNLHAGVGYARLRPADVPEPPVSTTDVAVSTLRGDLNQELSLPFYVGPVKVVPYAILDLTEYSSDVTGEDRGRIYEAGGVRASMPLTRLYPDVHSEFLNLDGINHKIVLSANYFAAYSDVSFRDLPQLDRLNDDATNQAVQQIRPIEPAINPGYGSFLQTSPLYDPQLYALRQLLLNKVDTLDTIDELQLDIRQRLQTKRGYPGMEHVVDWMTLDMSASYFPNPNRDNFGSHWAFLQYDYTWNVGDRTALTSSGWWDPFDVEEGAPGARVWTIGAYFNRPDRTNFYLGFREIFPLESDVVTAAVNYIFSPKYSITASASYDFGTNQSLSNSLVFTRMGSDLQVSLGITYNAITNNFGVTFEIFPNLVPEAHRIPGTAAFGSSTLGR
jgi:hypothetical protein